MKYRLQITVLILLVSTTVFPRDRIFPEDSVYKNMLKKPSSCPGECNGFDPPFAKAIRHKPQSGDDFILTEEIRKTWNYNQSHWQSSWKTIYKYDDNNNLIEELEEWTDGSGSKGRRTYYYDENNKLAEKLYQGWDTNHWRNIFRQFFFYDENGNLEEERHYAWWMDNEWHNADKFLHAYDGNNNRVYTLKQNYWNGSTWENEEKNTYLYDEYNNLIENVRQDWNNSDWVNYWKIIYLYDDNNNPVEILRQNWSDPEWIKSSRYLGIYDENSNLFMLLDQHWDWEIFNWVDNHKWTYAYDLYNNRVRMLSQTWFEQELYWLDQHKHTYYYLPDGYEQFLATNSGLNKTIEDFQKTEDDIVIEEGKFPGKNSSLISVEVLIDSVLHTCDGDLEFTLSHNGITDTLIFRAGSDGDNFTGTKLTDRGIDSIASGTAPFTGNYKPEKPLSPFATTDPEGTWTLSIYDGAEGNSGILYQWGLNLIYSSSIGIDNKPDTDPVIFQLHNNYPNPFSGETLIRYRLMDKCFVKLQVFTMDGKKVTTLLNQTQQAGQHEVELDVKELSGGIYFYRLSSGKYSQTKKLIIQK